MGKPESTQPKDGGTQGAGNTLDRATFGRRLRMARKRLGWTLAQMAELSDISISTISRAERGQLALSYEKFSTIGRVLQLDMSAMFSEVGGTAKPFIGPVVTRAGGGVVYQGDSVAYEFLGTAAFGKQMSPVLATVTARRIEGPEQFACHPGEEFVYVLSGSVEVYFGTGEVISLTKGDSLYFDSNIGHAYISVSRQLARIVGVTSSESNMRQQVRAATPAATSGAGRAIPGVVRQRRPR